MILEPGILALLLLSLVTSGVVLYAVFHAVPLLRHWNPASGSELQLQLERRTYLLSTLLAWACIAELAALLLFVYVAENLHDRFTGAMCAAGVLNVNPFGYPALLLKMATFLLAGCWLTLNLADSRAYDYPLVRVKYALLLLLAVPFLVEAGLLWSYLLALHPDVITSCCGSLFGVRAAGISGDLAALPPRPLAVALLCGYGATVGCALRVVCQQRGGYLLALTSFATFLLAMAAIVSFIALYFYALPTHHCPFCILQREYGFVGYPIYAALFAGATAGLAAGLLQPFRTRSSLRRIVPILQKRAAWVTLIAYTLVLVIVLLRIFTTDFSLIG